MSYYNFIGKIARTLPPEMAHSMAINALKHGLVPPARTVTNPALKTEFLGMQLPNPLGLAAGFDKNAEAVDGLLSQGFGFIELGTVTPLAQAGNPSPRLFRLPEDSAVINRFGFNSAGIHQFITNIKKHKKSGIIGANIGKNKDSLNAIYDYTSALEAVYPLVDYVTVNISSPNTVGLRDLQQKALLAELMQTMQAVHTRLANTTTRKPLLYKIAPDLSEAELENIIEVALENAIDGLIISNTTISRPESLISKAKTEKGGLSGKPLFILSTQTLQNIYRISKGKIPLIGAGGIASAAEAYEKIKVGASVLQLYTALVYHGFELVHTINSELVTLLERDGFKNIKEAVGINAAQ